MELVNWRYWTFMWEDATSYA